VSQMLWSSWVESSGSSVVRESVDAQSTNV
jgi:hypothetical protein